MVALTSIMAIESQFPPRPETPIRRFLPSHWDALSVVSTASVGVACALGVVGMVILTVSLLIAGKILGKKMGQLFRA